MQCWLKQKEIGINRSCALVCEKRILDDQRTNINSNNTAILEGPTGLLKGKVVVYNIANVVRSSYSICNDDS